MYGTELMMSGYRLRNKLNSPEEAYAPVKIKIKCIICSGDSQNQGQWLPVRESMIEGHSLEEKDVGR